MSLEYRRVGEESAELLTRIHEECFPRYWNRDSFTNFFTVKNTFAVLVENAGELAGMMVYRVVEEQADIITLATRPAFQRQGIAHKLLADALTHCKELGAEAMFLEVEEGNHAAIALYERAGFAHQGRRKLYYQQLNGTYTDALVMRKKL